MDPELIEERFGGITRLYGEAALRRFAASHVAVVGLGGVGSWCVEALARSGVGRFTLCDLDDVCLTNINRQLPATENTLGRAKTDVLRERIFAINPATEVTIFDRFYTETTSDLFFAGGPYDAIIDAIDSLKQKALLLATARARGIPIVSSGGAGGRRDPAQVRCDDLSRSRGDRLLMLVRKKLRGEYGFPRHGKGRFRIPSVFSEEAARYPWSDGTFRPVRENDAPAGIGCDGSLGTVMHVTATMGLFAVSRILDQLGGDAVAPLTNSVPPRGQPPG